jgi:hypothetical protein
MGNWRDARFQNARKEGSFGRTFSYEFTSLTAGERVDTARGVTRFPGGGGGRPYHRVMVRSTVLAVMLVAVTLAGVTGCSDGGGGGGGGSGLLAALGKVRATDSTRRYVEYGDVAAIRRLREGNDKRFLTLAGFGMGNLRNFYRTVSTDLAFDPMALREAISAGTPPDWSAIILGDYDVTAVNDKLAALGIERSGSGDATTWTASADGAITMDSPLVEIAGPNTLNNVRTAPGSFAFSPKRDTLSWVTDPGGDTLAGDSAMRTLADCLGGVVVAMIVESRGDTIAVGVRAPSSTDVTDVVCAISGSRDPATLRDAVNAQLASGRSPATDRAWSELLPEAKVELAGISAVRITSRPGPDTPPGRPVQMLQNRELNALLGLSAR